VSQPSTDTSNQTLYIVEITERPEGRVNLAAQLQQLLNLDAERAAQLVRRLDRPPLVVSKPVPLAQAERVAERFHRAGLVTRVREVAGAVPTVTQSDALQSAGAQSAASITLAEAALPTLLPITTPNNIVSSSNTAQFTPSSPASSAPNPQQYAVPPASGPVSVVIPVSSGVASGGVSSGGMSSGGMSSGGMASTSINSANAWSSGPISVVTNPTSVINDPWSASSTSPFATINSENEDMTAQGTTVPVTTPATAPSRRLGLRQKLLLSSLVPLLLTIACAVVAIITTVPGALRTMLLDSTRNPAIAFSDGVSGVLSETSNLAEPTIKATLQAAVAGSQQTFRDQNLEFMMITDADGQPVAGWYGDQPNLANIPAFMRTYVQTTARRSIARAYMEQNDIPIGPYNPASNLVNAAGVPLEIAGHPIRRNTTTFGAVVVGMKADQVQTRINGVLAVTVLVSLLPFVLALVAAVWLANSITQNIVGLVKAADEISLGNFDMPIEAKGNDELSDLALSLERMRTSLQESLDRLRRRRRVPKGHQDAP
jgi:HAMP domain-containing protein